MAGLKKIYYNLNFNLFLFMTGVITGSVMINALGIYTEESPADLLNRYFYETNSNAYFISVFIETFIRRVMFAALFFVFFETFDNIRSIYFLIVFSGVIMGVVLTALIYYRGIIGVPVFVLIGCPHVFIYFLSIYYYLKLKYGRYYKEKVSTKPKYKEYIYPVMLLVAGIVAETLNAMYILPIIAYLI